MLVEVSLDYIMREDPSTVVSISGQDAELEKWREGQAAAASIPRLLDSGCNWTQCFQLPLS